MNEKRNDVNPYAKGVKSDESFKNEAIAKTTKSGVVLKIAVSAIIVLCLVFSTVIALKIIRNNRNHQTTPLESDGKYVYSKTSDGTGYELRGYVAKDDGSFVLPFSHYPLGQIPEPIDQSEVLTLPSEFNNLPVTEINHGVFLRHMTVTEIVLPQNIKKITGSAFKDCYSIKKISFPKSIEKISASAFEFCHDIENISVEEGCENYTSEGNCLIETKTGDLVLGCTRSVIPGGGKVKNINEHAFSRRKGLESIVIPEGVTSIDDFAFDGSSDLKTVSVPNSLTFLGEKAFDGTLVDSTEIDGDYYYGNDKNPFVVLVGTKGTETYSVKDSTRIVMGLCYELKSITISRNVVYISPAALHFCKKLEKITVDKNNEYYYGENFLAEKNTGALLRTIKNGYVPADAGIKSIEDMAFYDNPELKSVTIPEGIETIADQSFLYCTSLESVKLPKSLKYLGNRVFDRCDSLKTLYFAGTTAEWNAIDKHYAWYKNAEIEKIICSDGEIAMQNNI